MYQFYPRVRFYFRRVDGGLELYRRDREPKLSLFGNFIEKVVKIKRFEASGFAVFYHSDSSAGVNDKDRCYIFRHTSMIYFFTKSSEYGLKRIGFGCVGYATFFVWLYKNSHLRGKISFCLAKYSLLSTTSLFMWQKDIFKMPFKNVCKIQNCKRNDIFINHFVLVFNQKIKNTDTN